MKPTDVPAFIDALRKLLAENEPVEDDELDNAHENADDGGNFNDTLDAGISLGERLMADEVRCLMEQHGIEQ